MPAIDHEDNTVGYSTMRDQHLSSSFAARIALVALFPLIWLLNIHSVLTGFWESSKNLNFDTNVVDDYTNKNSTDPCFDKEPLLAMLRAASEQSDKWAKIKMTQDLCQELPTYSEVTRLYGKEPVIIGLDTCHHYRELLAEQNNNTHPMPRIAGLFNTGTNAMARSLRMNLEFIDYKQPYEVPWGKHTPAKYKFNNTHPLDNPEPKHLVLPIVMIRDPYRWMKSMVSTNIVSIKCVQYH